MSINRRGAGAADPVVEDTGDLAKLVDQVVEGHTPIVVARDGEPKAALVSLEDYARLKQEEQSASQEKKLKWDEWFAKRDELHRDMLAARGGKPLDSEVVERAWREAREELEERDSRRVGL